METAADVQAARLDKRKGEGPREEETQKGHQKLKEKGQDQTRRRLTTYVPTPLQPYTYLTLYLSRSTYFYVCTYTRDMALHFMSACAQ